MTVMHLLQVPLVFPQGVAPGSGTHHNMFRVALNGRGQPVLRGSSLAGVLRSAYTRWLASPPAKSVPLVEQYFGRAYSGDEGLESALQIADCILNLGHSTKTIRTHHLRNRHTKTVVDGGLFSVEACPPGTSTLATLWLRDDAADAEESRRFLERLLGFLQAGLTAGGKVARGLGIAQLAGPALYQAFDLADLDQQASYLDSHWTWRRHPHLPVKGGRPIEPAQPEQSTLTVRLQFGIPPGTRFAGRGWPRPES